MALTQVKTAGIANDAVTGAKIADDQINSEHYVDGSIDNAHVADDQINSEHYHAGSIDHEHLADDCVDGDNIADNSVGLAALAHGTDGNLITFNASGAPAYVATGNDGQVLTSAGAGAAPTFEDAAGGAASFRNIAINGACNVAQRGTSGTGSGYLTVDRWTVSKSADEDPTQSQHALTSSDTGPWAAGFRNSFHITNGNNPGNTTGNQSIWYEIEAQDIRNSKWDYTNTGDYLTISYWVKTSVEQTYYGYIKSADGTNKRHAYSLGTLSANTWTKITKSFPGHADLQFDDNANSGLSISIYMYAPPAQTDSGVSLSAWATHSGSERMPDWATTFWQTNNATFEVTGLQVEATGSSTSATDFEHRSFADELKRCQRYYYHIPAPLAPGSYASFGNGYHFGLGFCNSTTNSRIHIPIPTTMRTNPSSLKWSGTQGDYMVGHGGSETQCNGSLSFSSPQANNSRVNFPCSGLTAGDAVQGMAYNGSAFLGFEAEL